MMWSGVCITQIVPSARVLSRLPSGILAKATLLFSVLLVGSGCAAAHKPQATTPEAYDWSDYKGTYAPGGDGKVDEPKPTASKPSSKPTIAKSDGDAKPAASDAKPKPASAASDANDLKAEMLGGAPSAAPSSGGAKKSKATIQGESVSLVSVDAVAGASKTVLKSKVVSTNVVVGQEYEQLQVVMKGVALQIIRPAASPDKSGPKVRSPKVRSASMSKTESGWYDPDADVFVLVKASKKASSKKTLAAILSK